MSAVADGDAVFEALLAKMDALRMLLATKVDANLSGDVLQSRSGALRASIRADLDSDGGAASASLESVGIPYAAIQEFGGRTAAHDIVATKAKALCFLGSGGVTFGKIVHHPGSTIPARSYLGSALHALRSEIVEGLKQTILDALDIDS